MTKRAVLSGYFGFKNFGDEAILSLLVNKLQSLKYSVTVISSNPDYTKAQFKHIRCVKAFDISNIAGFILKSDVLISGGGSLLQDVTSLKSLIYYLFIIFLGIFFNKKVIIFAQGIGPINNHIGIFLTKLLLKQCVYVSVRDKKSHELLKSWGINSELLCDPIFSLGIDNCKKTDTVAIQLRDFSTLTNDFIERLAQEIANNFSDKIIEIYSFQDTIDLKICQIFEKNLKMLNPDIKTKIYSALTNSEIIEKLSKAQYLIAMRFHAIIVGLLSKAKILGINYDTKVERICEEFSVPLLELNKEFENQFDDLKLQNPALRQDKLQQKEFDWTGFENCLAK